MIADVWTERGVGGGMVGGGLFFWVCVGWGGGGEKEFWDGWDGGLGFCCGRGAWGGYRKERGGR